MAEGHRLRPLQVRVAGHRPGRVFGGCIRERFHQRADGIDGGRGREPAVEAKIRHDLVVARPAGMQCRAGGRQLCQPAFDCGVYVLIGAGELECALIKLAFDSAQPALDRFELGRGDDAGRGQAARVRDAAGDVERIELEINLERGREALELRQHPPAEPPAPHLLFGYGASLFTSRSRCCRSCACRRPCTCEAVRTPKPQSLMKPAAALWSNASPFP